MDSPFVEEERSEVTKQRKVPFKQVSFGLNQLVSNDITLHEKLLKKALAQLQKSTTSTARQHGQTQVKEALRLLQRDLQQIEKMKDSVRDEELNKFCHAADPTCKQIHELIQSTKNVFTSLSENENEQNEDYETSPLITKSVQIQQVVEDQLEAEKTEQLRKNADVLEQIIGNMKDLQELVETFNTAVVEQKDSVDRIDEYIQNANINVHQGESLLAQARHYKTAVLPAVGLTVGFAAGGPIGAVAGFRIGLATSMIGGALGYAGGKMIHQFNRLKFAPQIPQIDS